MQVREDAGGVVSDLADKPSDRPVVVSVTVADAEELLVAVGQV